MENRQTRSTLLSRTLIECAAALVVALTSMAGLFFVSSILSKCGLQSIAYTIAFVALIVGPVCGVATARYLSN